MRSHMQEERAKRGNRESVKGHGCFCPLPPRRDQNLATGASFFVTLCCMTFKRLPQAQYVCCA